MLFFFMRNGCISMFLPLGSNKFWCPEVFVVWFVIIWNASSVPLQVGSTLSDTLFLKGLRTFCEFYWELIISPQTHIHNSFPRQMTLDLLVCCRRSYRFLEVSYVYGYVLGSILSPFGVSTRNCNGQTLFWVLLGMLFLLRIFASWRDYPQHLHFLLILLRN